MAEPLPAGDPFEALGDPNRRAIVELLGARARSVQELADALPISRPAVSRHLRLLKQAGLVVEEDVVLEVDLSGREVIRRAAILTD